MEKKVILLTDFYLPNNNANGLCIHRIGKAMQKQGYEVHVIAYLEDGLRVEEEIEGIQVHRVKPMFFYKMRAYYYKHGDSWKGKICWKLAVFGRRIKKILFMPWYPLVSPSVAKRYTKEVKRIANQYNICNIVAGYNPIESIYAAKELTRYSKYKVIAYFMDTFTLTENAQKSRFIFCMGRRWERKIYESVDAIANFPTYKQFFASEAYEKYREKMLYAGVPVDFDEFQEDTGDKEHYHQNQKINLLYTGGLTMGDREPMYLLKLLNKCNEDDLQMHFFSRGDAEDYLKKKQQEYNWIVAHGQVSFEELQKARSCADVMVNIGSQRTTILPSRLFEYISTGKPIIHIVYCDDDPCIEQLRKYPAALILNVKDSIDKNAQKAHAFLKENRSKSVSVQVLKKIYAEYSSEEIAKSFDKVFY